jgi:hypothetical protein
MRPIKQRRKLTSVGNSVGVTIDIDEARARGLVDEEDDPRDVEFAMEETDDGRLALIEAES